LKRGIGSSLRSSPIKPLSPSVCQYTPGNFPYASTGSFIYDGFVDFLDHKWRGPPPKLIDVARYAAAIRAEETRYNLTNTNCYWFSRVLFHTLALRHYAFPFIASRRAASANYQAENAAKKYRWTRYAPADWRHYDPSSTGIVFRFLAYQEDDSGALFLARFGIIIKVLATTIGVCGALVILPALITAEIRGRVLAASILALIATCTLFVGASLQIARLLDFSIHAPMRLKRQRVLDMFGRCIGSHCLRCLPLVTLQRLTSPRNRAAAIMF
jgi:hypothetical protein